MGSIGDRYGRKRLLVIGLSLFAAASLLATYAGGAGQLVAARAVMGVGAAILTPITLAILPVLFPPEERGKAIAAATMGMGIGIPLGPIIGGYLLGHFWWGSIFLVNLPVAAVALVAVALLVPESKDPTPRRVDLVGGLLSTAGLVLFVYGVIEAPARGWTSGVVVAALGAGLVLLAVFTVWELRTAQPMIDVRLFERARFGWSTMAATIASFALFGLLFVLPQYLQAVRGYDALGVGVRLLPMIVGLFFGAPLGEVVVRWLGTKVPVTLGLVVVAAAFLMGATTSVGSTYPFVAAWLAVAGLGTGLALAPAMDAVLGELPPERAGSGTAVTMTLRQAGGALGVALLGSISAAAYTGRLATAGLPPAPAKAAEDSVSGAMAVAARIGDEALAVSARGAYVHAMAVVLVVCAAVALAGALAVALFLPSRPVADTGGGPGESEHELVRTA
jgi:EmrB/QacA subfamily drug resistance transporter